MHEKSGDNLLARPELFGTNDGRWRHEHRLHVRHDLGAGKTAHRDVEQLLSQVMSVLFYATPILFPMASVPDWASTIICPPAR